MYRMEVLMVPDTAKCERYAQNKMVNTIRYIQPSSGDFVAIYKIIIGTS